MKEIDSDAGRAAATSEFLSMFETMRNVKGQDYAAVVRGAFALCNYHESMEGLGTFIAAQEAKEAFAVVHEAHSAAIRDVIRTMILQYMRLSSLETTNGNFARALEEITKDIKMLSDKQNEYGAFAFGEPE